MDNTIFHIDASALIRQGINCWFEYILSQPVDFDIPIMLRFLAEYVGLPIVLQFFIDGKALISHRIFGEDLEEENEGLVTQEMYSYQPHSPSDSRFLE
jgi:hypothetical protein